MPFYDFRCRKCGFEFNVMATIEEKENNLIPCPGCGTKALDRIYENAGFSVKSRSAAAHENCSCCGKASSCPGAKH